MTTHIPVTEPRLPAASIRRRTALLLGLAVPVGVQLAGAAPASALQTVAPTRLTLPTPTGRHRLGTTVLHLVDPSRPDPWVPADRVRELMIQVWYPAETVDSSPIAPYMTPATARAFEEVEGLPPLNWPVAHARLGTRVHPAERGWPVVLYSHSLGGERFETTCLVEDLASRGYIVVTIDHVHDADVVELPGGRIATCAIPPLTSQNQIQLATKAIVSRVADVAFVLDQLAVINEGGNPDHEHRPLPHGLRGALDLGRVGMFGQSDGGSTTAHALHTDARITVGVNLDGTLWTPQAVAGSDHPLLLFGRQDLDPYEASTWARLRENQPGRTLQLNLLGSTHHTFTDFAALVPQLAPILGMPPSWVTGEIGTIDGQRAVAVERAYVNAYFDTYLRHQTGILLTGPSPCYPEVRFAS
jgi:dienelactone hydrolase